MTKTGAKAAGALVLALAVGGAAHAATSSGGAARAANVSPSAPITGTNLVSDGDFNSPYGGTSFTTYSAGQSFGPWTVTSGSVDLIGGYWQNTPVGDGSVDVDGNAPGAFDQSINTGTGKYTLTFDLSGNPDGPPLTKGLQVSVGGVTKTFTYTTGTNTHANMMYTPESFTFSAKGPTTLTFTSLDQPGSPYGPVVADVSITAGAVPEPASWALMLLGLGAMGAAIRSYRRTTELARA